MVCQYEEKMEGCRMAQEFDNISFPGWEVVRKLGEGSFGGVYEIQRILPG